MYTFTFIKTKFNMSTDSMNKTVIFLSEFKTISLEIVHWMVIAVNIYENLINVNNIQIRARDGNKK